MNYQIFLTEILLDAFHIANDNFGKVSGVTIKGNDNNQVLTQTDLEIGTLIVDRIKKEYPDYNVIDEEAGGLYTDFWGKSIDYTDPLKRVSGNFTCCVAAPKLHKQLQEIIHQKEN